jgi:hypothetical protein
MRVIVLDYCIHSDVCGACMALQWWDAPAFTLQRHVISPSSRKQLVLLHNGVSADHISLLNMRGIVARRQAEMEVLHATCLAADLQPVCGFLCHLKPVQ